MPELRTTVNLVWIEYLCDACGSPVIATNVTSHRKGQTAHYCPNPKCRRQYLLDKTYPCTEEPPGQILPAEAGAPAPAFIF